jgi:hypothetical protein
MDSIKTPREILDETCAEVGMINFLNGIKTIQLKKWSIVSLEETILTAMRKYAQQYIRENEKAKCHNE